MIEYTQDRPLRVATLFSGYDSQCLALERLRRDFPTFAYTLVAWSEIDPAAMKAHDALFPEAAGKNLGDVSLIDWARAPDCDLLTYSFPCTSISSAGQQKGLAEGSGTASSLLWEVRKAIRAKHPRFLLMENVPALLQDKFRPYFMEWTRFLEGEGYSNFTKVLGAQDFGVPQHRDRVFCVSILGEDARYHFPRPFPLERRLLNVLEDTVDEGYYLSDERVQGLIRSTLKEQEAGRGFEFKPKTDSDSTANALTGLCAGRKTDNFIVSGAIRGRKDDPADRKHHLEMETGSPDVSNAIKSVRKDSLVVIGGCEGGTSRTIMAQYAKHKESGAREGRHAETLIMVRKDEQGVHNH